MTVYLSIEFSGFESSLVTSKRQPWTMLFVQTWDRESEYLANVQRLDDPRIVHDSGHCEALYAIVTAQV